jgi:hypothetical protein
MLAVNAILGAAKADQKNLFPGTGFLGHEYSSMI